jgi:hypothetical protein
MRALFLALMIFATPIPFSDALASREVRSILPTDLGTADLEQIQAEILERALFSARVTSAEYLQTIEDVLDRYSRGKLDLATARLELKQKLAELGYVPSDEDRGTLRDFSSDERTNLVIRINSEMAAGYGNWLHDQQPAVLNMWPAQELFRAFARKVPRDWISRWQDAGGELFDGRMIALRNTPIWTAISRFGTPYPPFDFNSGMRTRLVDRRTAMSLGLIDLKTQIKPQDRGFNDDLKFTPAIRNTALKQALVDEGYKFDGDVLTLGDENNISLGPTGGVGGG